MKAPITALPSLPGLNILRVLASLYIVMFHLGMFHLSPAFLPGPVHSFFSRGASATSLFFLLSGFLLTHLYSGREFSDQQQRHFVWRRLARILPANLAGLGFLLGAQFYFGHPDLNLGKLIECALLIQTWVVGDSYSLVVPAWSMSCLVFFYLLFPVLMPQLERFRSVHLIILMLALWALGSGLPLVLAHWSGVFGAQDWTLYLHDSPLTRAPEFFIGMGLALLVRRHGLPTRWLMLALPATLALMAFAPGEAFVVNNGIFAPVTACLLLAFANPGPLLKRVGNSRAMNSLASASICIYLIHSTWTQIFQAWVFPHWHLAWSAWTIILYLLVVTASALVLDRFLCRPLTNFLTKPLRAARAASQTPSRAPRALRIPSLDALILNPFVLSRR